LFSFLPRGELRGSFDEQGGVIGLEFFQHDDAGGDAGAEEKVGRQLNHCINEIIINKVLTDSLLRTTAIEHAREFNDGSCAVHCQPAQHVHNEGQICLGFRGEHARRSVARVVDEQGVVLAFSHLSEYGGLETMASYDSSAECIGSVSVSPWAISNFS